MKKTMIFFLLMQISTTGIYAQVTIGDDTSPAATLDVVANDSSTPAGVIAPRLTLTELAADDSKYLAAQTGAIVYVTNASGATTTKTAKVTAPGYYYFDGAVWQLVNGGTEWYAAGTANDAQTDKTGAISRNGRVAIYSGANPTSAAASPKSVLDIINDGGTDYDDDLGITTFSGDAAAPTPTIFLFHHRGTQATPSSLNMNDPIGSIKFGSMVGSNLNTQLSGLMATYKGDGTTKFSDLHFLTGAITRMLVDESGNVGIGTMTPTAKLSVNGSINNTTGTISVFSDARIKTVDADFTAHP